MKVIGSEQEIQWAKEAFRNNCAACPYAAPCDEEAKKDSRKFGEVRHTCRDFLDGRIEFIIENKI